MAAKPAGMSAPQTCRLVVCAWPLSCLILFLVFAPNQSNNQRPFLPLLQSWITFLAFIPRGTIRCSAAVSPDTHNFHCCGFTLQQSYMVFVGYLRHLYQYQYQYPMETFVSGAYFTHSTGQYKNTVNCQKVCLSSFLHPYHSSRTR